MMPHASAFSRDMVLHQSPSGLVSIGGKYTTYRDGAAMFRRSKLVKRPLLQEWMGDLTNDCDGENAQILQSRQSGTGQTYKHVPREST